MARMRKDSQTKVENQEKEKYKCHQAPAAGEYWGSLQLSFISEDTGNP